MLCAVWWGLLKYFGAFYVGRTIDNAGEVFGQLAIVVGLLVFINLAAQLLMLTASIQAELVLGPVEAAAPTVGLVEASRGHPPFPAGGPAPGGEPAGASAAWPWPPPRSPGSPAAPAVGAGSPARSPELPAGPAAEGSGSGRRHARSPPVARAGGPAASSSSTQASSCAALGLARHRCRAVAAQAATGRRRCGGVAVSSPLGWRCSRQPPSCTAR